MAVAEKKEGNLLTLSEVSKRTGISMPTLQRYKKLYQSRIPSVGSGRKQRYPEEALPVFQQLKEENIGRRGRPRKSGAGARRKATKKVRKAAAGARKGRKKAAAKTAARGAELLTLTQVSEMTGISYPTLVRYVKLHGSKIPHKGEGRSRRFYPRAVEVFKKLRAESGRGRKAGGTRARAGGRRAAGGDQKLQARVRALEKLVQDLEKKIRKPIKVTISPR